MSLKSKGKEGLAWCLPKRLLRSQEQDTKKTVSGRLLLFEYGGKLDITRSMGSFPARPINREKKRLNVVIFMGIWLFIDAFWKLKCISYGMNNLFWIKTLAKSSYFDMAPINILIAALLITRCSETIYKCICKSTADTAIWIASLSL